MKSGILKNGGIWSSVLVEIFPEIALLITGVGILQKYQLEFYSY